MTLSSYSIANLIQGISQQPDSQRDPTQGELQINGYSSLADGLRKRAGTSVIRQISSTPLGDVFFHSILRDSGEKYLVVIGRTAIRVFDLDGIEKTVSAPFGYSYLFTVTSCATDVRAATIADYTFVSSVKRVPAMSAALAPATARPAANEALVWVRAANYGQTYRVSVNGTLATVTTPVQPVTTSGSTVTENRISTADIAESIKTALAGVSGVTIARQGSVLHVTSSSAITVAATDARANADITAITSTVQAFTDLPTIAPKGYQVEIVGDPSNQYDGYFVAFVPRGASATFGEGTWQECVAPGMPYELDATTMPQLLVRLSNGTFYFGPANGSTQSGTKIPSWGQRTAGDFDTAPDPSFIGYPIQDVFVHRNRLGLLADENVILSRAKAFFDFFPETVSRVLDTDPIDLSASSNRVSVLRYAVPIQDEVILFSDQLQFRLSSDAAGLTPASATVSVLTAFEADMSVKPLQVASGIVFAQSNGSWSQFRELSIRSAGSALTGSAPSLTDHVPTFIPSGAMQLASNDAAGVWLAISNELPPPGRDPFISLVWILLHMDGGNGSRIFPNSSSYNFTVTAYGDAQVSTTDPPFGSGWLTLDGTGDFLRATAPVPLTSIGSQDYTAECWALIGSGNTGVVALFGFEINTFRGPAVLIDSGNWVLRHQIESVMGAVITEVPQHVALARENGKLRFFVGGVQLGPTLADNGFYVDNDLGIGIAFGMGDPIRAKIDELRVTVGIARYTANFTPPSGPFPDE